MLGVEVEEFVLDQIMSVLDVDGDRRGEGCRRKKDEREDKKRRKYIRRERKRDQRGKEGERGR